METDPRNGIRGFRELEEKVYAGETPNAAVEELRRLHYEQLIELDAAVFNAEGTTPYALRTLDPASAEDFADELVRWRIGAPELQKEHARKMRALLNA